jgi:2-succinyl-5-enolpyruvyl-6-hydroxy-3-cyclohexene-1-carboxylate synthase
LNNHVKILSEICSQFGIEHAVICPGSRSAPLVFAFNRNKNIKTYSIIDERSAAYMALGMAQQLQKPVALICTSGTAALNFYPAIAEAFYQKIPLIVLTADRPADLLNQQDGQMINQVNVFGSHVRGSLNFDYQNLATGNWHLATSNLLNNSIFPVMGPVHFNVPLVEPLYENLEEEILIENLEKPLNIFGDFDNKNIIDALQQTQKRVIIIGQNLPDQDLLATLKELANKGFAILADVVSNQHESSVLKHFDFLISQANNETLRMLEPDFIISLGGPVLSKALKLWLKKQKPKYHFRIQQDETLVDTYNNVTEYIFGNNNEVIKSIVNAEFPGSTYAEYLGLIEQKSEVKIAEFIDQNNDDFNELTSVNYVLKNLPENSQLQIANSTSIRYVSYLGLPYKNITAFCNRGTSGIDGCTSTAIGAAIMTNKIVTLITGDLAFFYDRNAFWNNFVPNNLRIILLNNHGGGIFNLIDGPNSQPELEKFFLTKHHLTAKNIADENELNYSICRNKDEFANALATFYNVSEHAKIIELSFDMDKSAAIFKSFKKIVL